MRQFNVRVILCMLQWRQTREGLAMDAQIQKHCAALKSIGTRMKRR